MTVGFKSYISASTNYNGIHFFNWNVFKNLSLGYALGDAILAARSLTHSELGGYYGSEHVEWNGDLRVLP